MREHGPLIWLPTVAGTASHLPLARAEILDRGVDLAVLLDEIAHDVVDRLELLGVALRLPGREGQDVVAGLRLRFGGDGQQVLVALRGDVVDLDLDLLLLAPLLVSALVTLLAPGTQWSQKPIEILPAALAVRTNGAAIIVADAAAVVATKRRRVIFAFVMSLPPRCRSVLSGWCNSLMPAGACAPAGPSDSPLGGRQLAEIAGEALVRALEMMVHRGARARRVARGNGVADRHVLLVRERAEALVFGVARELLEIRIDAQVEQFADEAHEHGVVERFGYGGVEAAVEHEIGVARALPALALGQNAVEPRHVRRLGQARRFLGNRAFHKSARAQDLE